MPNAIKTNHINYCHDRLMAISDAEFDVLDQYMLLGDYCVKHDIKPSDLATATYAKYDFSVSEKTAKNKIASAAALVRHFGSLKKAEAAIDKYNGANTPCSDTQTLAKKLGVQQSNKSNAGKQVDCIDQLVLDGVLSVKTAKVLKANGYVIIKK